VEGNALLIELCLVLPVFLILNRVSDLPYLRQGKPAVPQETLIEYCESPPVIRRGLTIHIVCSTSFLPHELYECVIIVKAFELPIVVLGDALSVLIGFVWFKVVAQLFASPLIALLDVFWRLGLRSCFFSALDHFLQPPEEVFIHDPGHQVGHMGRVRDSGGRRVHPACFVGTFLLSVQNRKEGNRERRKAFGE
jgi:hypothetical protein